MTRSSVLRKEMRRREFITLIGGAAAWPLAAHAQQPARQQRMAMFHPAIPPALLTETGGGSAWRAFFGELRRLGYVEGDNLLIEISRRLTTYLRKDDTLARSKTEYANDGPIS